MSEERFLQTHNIEAAFVPVDMQTAANDGDWINLSLYEYCVIVLFKAAGTAGQDPIFTLQQATSAAGGSAKALNVSTIYSKVGTLTGVANFTRITQAAGATYIDLVSAEAQAILAAEVRHSELDLANGFRFINITIPDVGGNAQLGCAFYILGGCRYSSVAMPDAKV